MNRLRIQPFHIAWALIVVVVVLSIVLFPWLSKVFRGDVLLNQTIVSLKLDYLGVFGFHLPFSDLSIRFYSAFMLFAFFSGYLLTLFLAKRSYLPDTLVDRLLVGIVLFGLLGARIFFVLFNLPHYFGQVKDVVSFFGAIGNTLLLYEGGLAIWGGVIACVLYIKWYCSVHKFSFLEVLDLLVPGLLLGQIIGRWGNFFNYEAYGAPTNVFWKMYVPEGAVNGNKYIYSGELAQYFHPTFLYEMIPNIILLFFILVRYNKLSSRSSGLITALYLIGYGAIRFVTEFFRLDALKIPLSLQLNVPESVAKTVTTWLPADMREPIVHWLQHLSIQGILVSQLVAIGAVVVGVWLYQKRSGVIYSPEKNTDIAGV